MLTLEERQTIERLEAENAQLKHRIAKALIMSEFGQNDARMHARWGVDQMVRALCGGAVAPGQVDDPVVAPYAPLDVSPAYLLWIAEYEAGEHGPQTYRWDAGRAP